MPKIHKTDIPLRPIVSSIGSATYHLARELARILTPLKGQSSSYIRNSSHFVEKIQEVNLQESDRMVSFDVRSLFTKVPIQEALQVIEEKLQDDTSLDDRTMMSPSTICHLTELCMKSTYFKFEDQLYEQTEGAPMGSPLSPVIADLYMEF